MKDLKLLVWITQLGLSIAMPMAGFTLLGVWLRDRFGLGAWVVLVGCAVGLISAARSFIGALRFLSQQQRKQDPEPPVGFNRHE